VCVCVLVHSLDVDFALDKGPPVFVYQGILIKGLVHPKTKILSVTHPHVVPIP